MKNTEYKCMCCGFVGNQKDFGINPKLNSTSLESEFETCPSCGSIDICNLVIEDNLAV